VKFIAWTTIPDTGSRYKKQVASKVIDVDSQLSEETTNLKQHVARH